MKKKEKKVLFFLILGLVLLDQVVKIIIQTFGISLNFGSGLTVGVEQNVVPKDNLQYILISIIAIMVLFRYINSKNSYIKMDSKIVLSFAISGVIGNLIDRILRGFVVNYINIPNFSAINLSYIYIIITWIGMAAILTKFTADRLKEKKLNENNSGK